MRSWLHPLRRLSQQAFLAATAAVGMLALGSQSLAAEHVEAVDRGALRVCADPRSLPFSNQKL